MPTSRAARDCTARVGGHAPWLRLDTEYLNSYPLGRLRRDTVRLPSGRERTITFTESTGAAYVVPVTLDGKIVLIRQYRYVVGEWLWEVPAGALFDHPGTAEELARQELLEEVGGEAERLIELGSFYDAAPVSTSRCTVFLALGVRLDRPQATSESEMIEVHAVEAADAFRMAEDGTMSDGRSAHSLSLARASLGLQRPRR